MGVYKFSEAGSFRDARVNYKSMKAAAVDPFEENNLSRTNIRLFLDPYYKQSYPGTGSTWFDLSGASRNATLVNSPTYNQVGFTLNGVNQYASLSGGIGNPSGDWSHSIMGWFKPSVIQSAMPGTEDPWFMGAASPNQASSFEIASGRFRHYFFSNDADYTSSQLLTTTAWFHLAVTYSGGGGTLTNKKMYVNGVNIPYNAGGSTSQLSIGANAPLWIGFDFPRSSFLWNGSIGQFVVYDGAVTPTQILNNFNATKARHGL
jgi:hypothetical protein